MGTGSRRETATSTRTRTRRDGFASLFARHHPVF